MKVLIDVSFLVENDLMEKAATILSKPAYRTHKDQPTVLIEMLSVEFTLSELKAIGFEQGPLVPTCVRCSYPVEKGKSYCSRPECGQV